MHNKTCPWCEKDYSTKDNKQKYCSHNCAGAAGNKARLPKEPRQSTQKCLNCDSFVNIKTRATKYCSLKCQKDLEFRIRIEESENGIKPASHQTYRNYLIRTFGAKCVKCDWKKVNPITNKVPIELNHIDGNSNNTKLSNLELLCPNCHSLTPTYKALNVGNGRHSRIKRYHEGKSF